MQKGVRQAAKLHENVPPDWYFKSIQENLLQKYWHGRRFDEIKKLIEQTRGKILDIGSADGVFTKIIADKSGAKEVIGIDVLQSSVDWANKHWKDDERLKFKLGDAHKLRFNPNTFDAVFAFEVLEHVADPKKVLIEIKRVLKKGGYAVFLVPTDNLIFKIGWDYVWTKTRGRVWHETHIHSFAKSSLVELAREIGFKIDKDKKFILGMLQAIKVRKSESDKS